jgi:hypothetical protein
VGGGTSPLARRGGLPVRSSSWQLNGLNTTTGCELEAAVRKRIAVMDDAEVFTG